MSCATGLLPHSLNDQCGRLEDNLDDLAFVQQPWQVINTLHVKIRIILYCLISFLTGDNQYSCDSYFPSSSWGMPGYLSKKILNIDTYNDISCAAGLLPTCLSTVSHVGFKLK